MVKELLRSCGWETWAFDIGPEKRTDHRLMTAMLALSSSLAITQSLSASYQFVAVQPGSPLTVSSALEVDQTYSTGGGVWVLLEFSDLG